MKNSVEKPNFKELIGEISKNENKKKILVAVLISGIVLIFLSEFKLPKHKEKPKEIVSDTQYAQYIEGRLCDIINSIDGVEKSKVMVTLESGTEFIFAEEISTKSDKSDDLAEKTTRREESESKASKYILVEGEKGNKTALVQNRIQPKIKGVAIVCSGKGGAVVEKEITDTVTTVLGIGSNQVNVAVGNRK